MITVNIEKARLIAHDVRRAQRQEALAPLDSAYAHGIPGTNIAEIEAQREAIRQANAQVQEQIDEASSVDELRAAIT